MLLTLASTIYCTTATREEALAIGHELVAERLAACANVLDGMTSVYVWEGQVQESSEAVLLLKTRTELVPAAMERIRRLHGYNYPCLVAWPITQASDDYLGWIFQETQDAPAATDS